MCLDEEWAVEAGQEAYQDGLDQAEQRIRELEAERDRYRTMLERLDKYFNSDRWHLWHLEANAQVDLVQMTREIKDALRGSDDD
jgi:chromosome segregation ATPase